MPQPKDKDWLNGYKSKMPNKLSTRDPPQNKGHIQPESEGLGKKKKKFMQMETKRKQESQYTYQIK